MRRKKERGLSLTEGLREMGKMTKKKRESLLRTENSSMHMASGAWARHQAKLKGIELIFLYLKTWNLGAKGTCEFGFHSTCFKYSLSRGLRNCGSPSHTVTAGAGCGR